MVGFAISLLKILALAMTFGLAAPFGLIAYCFVVGLIYDSVEK